MLLETLLAQKAAHADHSRKSKGASLCPTCFCLVPVATTNNIPWGTTQGCTQLRNSRAKASYFGTPSADAGPTQHVLPVAQPYQRDALHPWLVTAIHIGCSIAELLSLQIKRWASAEYTPCSACERGTGRGKRTRGELDGSKRDNLSCGVHFPQRGVGVDKRTQGGGTRRIGRSDAWKPQ